MTTDSSISINNYFSTSKSCVTFRSSYDEFTCRVYVKNSLSIYVCSEFSLYHFTYDIGSKYFHISLSTMLIRDYYGIYSGKYSIFILATHLRLSIWSEIGKYPLLAYFFKSASEFMGEVNRSRHTCFIFITCIAKHYALISRSSRIHSLSDIRRLCVNKYLNRDIICTKTYFKIGISDISYDLASYVLKVYPRISCYLSTYDNRSGGSHTLTGNS